LGNGATGVTLYAVQGATVGGTTDPERNVISANGGAGLHIYRNCNASSGSTNSTVFNNYIGTTTSGGVQAGYGNQGAGIETNEYYGGCTSVYRHQIGGDGAGEPNVIAGNDQQGVLIHQASSQDVFSITVIANSIHSNGQFGIDLAADGDPDNGVADLDLGPNPLNAYEILYPTERANYYINRPTVNSVSTSGNQVTVNYDYQANPVGNSFPELLPSNLVGYRLDFYINNPGQDGAYANYSQGKTHLGSFIVDGSTAGASHVFTSPVTLNGNEVITSTATVLWQIIGICDGTQQGSGPPYSYCGPT
jgi:hypothetical protein